MTKPLNPNNSAITKLIAEKILATVTYDNGFHFFTSIGQYTGETAVSLETFAKKVEHAPIESIDFHFKRADFQRWISDTIGDIELAKAIGGIEKDLSGEPLRRRILKIITEHLKELEYQIDHPSGLGSKK